MSEMPPPPPPPAGPPVPPPPPPMGGGYSPQPGSGAPKDYFVLAIIGTILSACSCVGLVLGILSIVYSNKVKQAVAIGDMNAAQQASNTTKIFVIITWVLIALGVVGWIIATATGSFNTGR